MSESIDTEAIRADTRRWWSRDGNCWVAADDEPLFLTDDPSIAAEIVADHNALLDEIDKLRRGGRTLGRIIERHGKRLVEATHSQDVIDADGDGDWEIVWDRLFTLARERDSLRAENDRLRLDQSLDAGEIVDVLTDAGIAPADYGGSIKSAIEALVGMDRITTANLAAAEAKLAEAQCTSDVMTAEYKAAMAKLAAAERSLAKIRGWATTNHGGVSTPAEVWPGLAEILGVVADNRSNQ